MTTTQLTITRYTIGQSVEVFVTDFDTPGFPTVWKLGTVTEVAPLNGGLSDVMVNWSGKFSPQIVGKRGGNKNIRVA